MKKVFTALMLMVLAIPAFAKDIKTIVVTTQPPMHCESCENRIMEALRFEKGVKDVKTSVADQRVEIKYDADKTTPEALFQALEKGGFKATVKGSEAKEGKTCSKGASCCGKCTNQ